MHCCDSKTVVVETQQREEGIWRRRRCDTCKKLFYTMEVLYVAPEKIPKPVIQAPRPDERGLYKPKDAVAIKTKKVETRRRNEDRVSNYYIEDDYDESSY